MTANDPPNEDQASRRAEFDRLRRRSFLLGAVLSNVVGALVVFLFAFLLPVPISSDESARLAVVNGIATAIFLAVALPIGYAWSARYREPTRRWLDAGRPPTDAERRNALRMPFRLASVSAVLWSVGAIVFGAIQLPVSVELALLTLAIVLLGGITTSAMSYLIIERTLRPVTARALAEGPPSQPVIPGVQARLITVWTLATAVPLLGIAAIAIAVLSDADVNTEEAAAAALFLVVAALAVGLLALNLAARSIADPLSALRGAVRQVEGGELDVSVPVDDGSEIGLLEAGFNRMAAGLRERERLRDLFGRHVGRDVARAALDREVVLGGEEREVAALFIDLVGSTALAAERPPGEVVALLNRFFRIVVEVVEEHGGLVNKFEGDAALCVFGAPVERSDYAAGCLAAARTLRERLRDEVPELDFGLGASAGTAVAGNIGAEERFEYTVIGDPINEAARLCELGKERPERVLVSEPLVRRARDEEADRWRLDDRVTLRGRREPTRLATVAAGSRQGSFSPRS